jgi:hypothetical protein
MKSAEVKDPKDSKIINKDDSVTNKDSDNISEKEQPTDQKKTGTEHVLTLISDNDNAGILADESASNKGQGPAGENL